MNYSFTTKHPCIDCSELRALNEVEVQHIGGGVRKQTLACGTVVYRGFGPAPIGYEDTHTLTSHS